MRYNHFDMLPERAFLKVGGRITLEGGGSGGGGTSTQTSTSYQTNIPAYLEDPTKRLVARGETLSEQAYQPYTGERVAGFNPMQTQAFTDLSGLGTPSQFGEAGSAITGAEQFGTVGALQAMGYQPTQFNQYQMSGPSAIGAGQVQGTGYDAYGVQAAPDVTGTSYQAALAGYTPQWNQQTASQYMSPYQQAVTDIAKREATTEAAALNRQLAAQAAKAGAFGGSRFGVEQALLGSKLATNLSDIQTKGSEAAYQAGLGQFNTEQAARQAINLANQGALNQAGQFGATQAQAAALANQQVRQQANLASQQAYNQALQFGATQAQAAQIANQQANLTASQANQQMQYQTGVQNLQAALTTQQQQDAARQAAANLNLQGAQFGAQTGLSAAERLGALGTASQAADLQRIVAQQSAGAQQQALEQQKLDTAYQQAIEQRDWEKNQLGYLSGLIRGTPFSTSQLQTQSAPGATTASTIASLGLGAYGLSSLLGKKDGGVVKMAKGGSVEGYAYGGSISGLTDKQLQDAAMGNSSVISPEDAKHELARRAKLRTAVQGARAEEELAGGIAGLEADNMEFADGGIVGYSEGGDVPRYNGNKEYGSVVYGGIEYPIDPTTGKVLYKGVWTAPSLLKGSATSPWNTVGVKPEQTVQQKADAIAANEQMIADVQAGKGVMKNGSYYPIITEGKNAGKVDYKGIPTLLDKRMFDTTPPERLVKPSADNALQAEHAAAAVPPETPAAPAAAPAAAPTASAANRRGVAPGTPAAAGITANLATQSEDPYERMLAGAERIRAKMAEGEKDPFADTREAMAEQKAAYADMSRKGLGFLALQAAGEAAKGGPGGTLGQLGRTMGVAGEAGFKLQNQLQAARQAELSSRVMMAQAEEARNRGLRTEAIQLATGAEQAGLQAAKLKQDYTLTMEQIRASRANAGRNTQLEFYQALQKDPALMKTYLATREPQEKPLSDADILKSWDPLKYPGMTYSQYYAAMKNAGNMAPTSSLSAADQALVNKYAKQ